MDKLTYSTDRQWATQEHTGDRDVALTRSGLVQQLKKARWALARITFIVYIGFSVVSLVGGFLSAPLMTWYFFGDWRFWRYWSAGVGLLPHSWRLLKLMLSDKRGFMFSVPLSSPPRSIPDPVMTTLHPNWPHGQSCGDCSNCCRAGGFACPLLDETLLLCRGHDSFYWRYFNCGRFPSVPPEIGYYDCRKWILAPTDSTTNQRHGHGTEHRDGGLGLGFETNQHGRLASGWKPLIAKTAVGRGAPWPKPLLSSPELGSNPSAVPAAGDPVVIPVPAAAVARPALRSRKSHRTAPRRCRSGADGGRSR